MSSAVDFASDFVRTVSEADEDRITKMKSTRWIGYDRAVDVRRQIEGLLSHPRTHRMPNIALIAETNNGKTMVLKNLCKKVNPPIDPNAEKTVLPILMIQTPPSADEGRLYYAILDRLSAAGSAREPEDAKLRRIHIILSKLETRMLILDDFFNVASSNPGRRRKFLNALRNLSIALEMPIVISGTPETLNILTVDPSISNRFKPVFLPKWTGERIEEFARFMTSIETILMLKQPCDLMDEETLKRLLALGEGLLGEIVAILKLYAEWAIRTGTESIGGDVIARDNHLAMGWVMPSDRSRHRE
jgi:hypothetical protein